MTTTTLKVDGMTCPHCVQAVTQAARSVDPAAEVDVDLPTGHVRIRSTAQPDRLTAAITAEGYTAAQLHPA